MRRLALTSTVAGMRIAAIGIPCLAQDFKPCPGCTLDEKAGREPTAAAPGKQSQVWTTSDSFDKVYAFYKGLYKEYTMRHGGGKLPSGQQVRWAFFILDGGKDLASSAYWMKTQWPYVGRTDGKDVRDITGLAPSFETNG